MLFTQTGQGSRSSEGDITHLAVAARAAFGATGAGVKIGVLSDGVRNLAASQAGRRSRAGHGPSPAQTGTGDEGTAMLEIIHDLAPGAQLYFATAFGSISSFADNIRALRAAGCDIIVDDVFYFVETPFQDGQTPASSPIRNGGVVIQAVKDVTAAGALYFSSAGNWRQSQRRHVGHLGGRLRRRRPDRPRRCRRGACTASARRTFNALHASTAARRSPCIGPIRSADRRTTTTCSG